MSHEQDEISYLLFSLSRHVDSAERENRQGWSIRHDLVKIQRTLDKLKALDEKNVNARVPAP